MERKSIKSLGRSLFRTINFNPCSGGLYYWTYGERNGIIPHHNILELADYFLKVWNEQYGGSLCISTTPPTRSYDWWLIVDGVIEETLPKETEEKALKWFEELADAYTNATLLQVRADSTCQKFVDIKKY